MIKEVKQMLNLLVGLKGTGKTKTLISMVNSALDKTNGNVVCIEKGTKLIHEIKYQARLVDTEEYNISGAADLYGFVAGILASNHDVTDIFIDSSLKICGNDIPSFTEFILKADSLCKEHKIHIVCTASVAPENVPESLNGFILAH